MGYEVSSGGCLIRSVLAGDRAFPLGHFLARLIERDRASIRQIEVWSLAVPKLC